MIAGNCGRRGLGRSVPIALAILYLAGGCSPNTSDPPDVARPVKTMVVAAGDEPHVRSFPGKVEASKKVELAFRVSGLLVKLPVKEGQKVAKGEVIAQLRQDEFQARLKALQGQLDQARAGLKALRSGERPEQQLRLEAQVRAAAAKLANTRTEYNRAAQLLRSRSIARADYDLALTAHRVAQEDHKAAVQLLEKGTIGREEDIEAREAEVRGLEGRVVEANIQLEDSTLRAPYDGVIAKRFVEQKQNVKAKDPVVRFQDVDEIDVAVDVPETVMATMRATDIVQILAEFSGAPGLQFPVHIKEVAQRADPTTQTFQVRVAMKVPRGRTHLVSQAIALQAVAPAGVGAPAWPQICLALEVATLDAVALQIPPEVNLLPGMTATVTLTYRRASILGGRVLVPIAAVSRDGTGQQVAWVVGSEGTVTARPVKLGEATGGRIEIVDGLEPGDRIAVAGVTFLREGMKVRDLGDALGGS
jgi:membrane fusion protein, multidrug efflux system